MSPVRMPTPRTNPIDRARMEERVARTKHGANSPETLMARMRLHQLLAKKARSKLLKAKPEEKERLRGEIYSNERQAKLILQHLQK
ncbi:MAG: hypothetical protein AABW59_00395 [archaeon]